MPSLKDEKKARFMTRGIKVPRVYPFNSHGLKDESKRSRGLFGPRTPEPKDFVLWTPIADNTWSAKKALFPLLLGDTQETRLPAVVLLARRLSAAKPDAKHPGKCEKKAGK